MASPYASSRATPMGKNAREMYLQNLRLGGGGFNSSPSNGGPPRTGKPPTASVNKFLKGVVSEALTGNPIPVKDASPYSARSSTPSSGVAKKVRKPSTSSAADDQASQQLQEQIIELKKEILAHQTERSILKSKMHQLEKQCARKDQQIDGLLATQEASALHASAQPQGMLGDSMLFTPASTLAAPQSATAQAPASSSAAETRLTLSLKQQVKDLQAQVKEREAALQQLQTSLKATSIDELTIETNTYYQEVLRLRKILEDPEPDASGARGTGGYLNPSAMALQQAREQARILEKENADLKADLEQALQAAYKLKEELGAPVDERSAQNKYEAMTRKDLVRHCVEMESTMKVMHLENERLVRQNEGLLAMQSKLKDSEAAIFKQKIDDLERANEQLQKINMELSKREMQVIFPTPAPAAASPQVSRKRDDPPSRPTSAREAPSSSSKAASRASVDKTATASPKPARASTATKEAKRATAPEEAKDDEPILPRRSESALDPALTSTLKSAPKLLDDENDLNLKSRTAINLQNQQKKKQEQKRETFIKKNKEDIDGAVALIQAALRGHLARKRIAQQLEQQDWVKVTVDGKSSSSSSSTTAATTATASASSRTATASAKDGTSSSSSATTSKAPVRTLSMSSSALSRREEPKPAPTARKKTLLETDTEDEKDEKDERQSDGKKGDRKKGVAKDTDGEEEDARSKRPGPAASTKAPVKASPPKQQRPKTPEQAEDSASSVEYVDEEEDLVASDGDGF